jgi:hypothetical protein
MDKHRGKATVFMFATGLKPRRRGANGIFGWFFLLLWSVSLGSLRFIIPVFRFPDFALSAFPIRVPCG